MRKLQTVFDYSFCESIHFVDAEDCSLVSSFAIESEAKQQLAEFEPGMDHAQAAQISKDRRSHEENFGAQLF